MNCKIRLIHSDSLEEIELVALRMRETLVEVLGEERGKAMYSMEWLAERVRFHLDKTKCTGDIFVAENNEEKIIGHCIVRIDKDENENAVGLFSTTYVIPQFRQRGVASALLKRGEVWMREKRMRTAMTYTDEENVNFIALYKAHGYQITANYPDVKMIRLSKEIF